MSLSSLFGKDADILRETNFQVLFLGNILGPLGLGLLSPVLDSLIDPLGTSAASIGLLMSAYTAPAIVLIPLAGLFADLFGRKSMLIGGILLLSPTGAAIALTTDFRVAIILRLLQGVGAAAIVPIIIASLGDLYEGTREATAQGLRFTSSGLTLVAFPLIAGAVVVFSWRFPFLLYLIGLPIVVVISIWFDEPASSENPGDTGGIGETLRSLREMLSNRHVQAVVFIRGLPGMLWIGFLTYNSIIVVQFLNRDPVQAGILAALGSFSFAFAASQAGRITALFSSRIYPLLTSNIALGVGFSIVVLAPTLPLAMIGTVSLGWGFGITLSMYRSLITGMAPPALRGSIVSVAESFGRLTITATPAIMGLVIASLSPRLGFQLAVQTVGVTTAMIAAVGGIGGLLVANATPPPYTRE